MRASLLTSSFLSPFLSLTFLFLFACTETFAVPVWKRQVAADESDLSLSGRRYSQYQISDGVGGTAKADAWDIVSGPFVGVELETVPYDVYEGLWGVWEDVDYANEVAFPGALQRAEDSEALSGALRVGKTKNEVLLYTLHRQILQIKLAKQSAYEQPTWDVEDRLDEIEELLQVAVEEDAANAGQVSMSVQLDFDSF